MWTNAQYHLAWMVVSAIMKSARLNAFVLTGSKVILTPRYLHPILRKTGLKVFFAANKWYHFNLGPLCELEVDECENHVCQNDATCVDGTLTYSCNCSPGFT